MITWPQELLDAVVGKVPDNVTLQQCSLASKSLLVASQRGLFHSVSVKDKKSIRRATQQFTAFPHFRSYVKELDVSTPESKSQLKELASLLPIFPDVARIKWSGEEWPKFLVTALMESLQKPSMQSLTLMICEDMAPSLLSYAAASVRHLDLAIVSLDNHAEPVTAVAPSAQLKHLSHTLGGVMGGGRYDTIRPLLPHLSGLEVLESDISSAPQFKLLVEAEA
ncbi:hypothetical protein FB45DRAFT_1108199 [Roridomyces roridus]|uniref:Uncharacterized protein n=1 Tax=Roridomyces roridus TaxID=1738132 RepID=A0AAD7FFE7_9AGAR|nr:hypothetical protein FB45DRAFT_1108199 [Roridomyces roridus]